MAILTATGIVGAVEAVLTNDQSKGGLATRRVASAEVSFAGLRGDCHASFVRDACVRTRRQYPIGTRIRNTRQVTIVSVEDLGAIADRMGLDSLRPEWLGANILVSGIPAFTLVPPSSRLIFSGGASLVVDMENAPCKFPGEVIDAAHPGYGRLFAHAARNLRGVTAWVEKEGIISAGDTADLHIPPQRIYDPGKAPDAET